MKYLLVLMVASLGFTQGIVAQTKAVQVAKIKTPNALCPECVTRIKATLDRYDGIMSVDVNYRRGETKVKYVTDRIDIEQIKTAIANMGYDADDVSANPEAYKKLPKTCKKFEDGGGHPKPKPVPVADSTAG